MDEKVSAVQFQIIPECSVPFENDPVVELNSERHYESFLRASSTSCNPLPHKDVCGSLIKQNVEVRHQHQRFIYLANCFEDEQRIASEWASASGLLRQYSKNRNQAVRLVNLCAEYRDDSDKQDLDKLLSDNERIIKELVKLNENLRQRKESKI